MVNKRHINDRRDIVHVISKEDDDGSLTACGRYYRKTGGGAYPWVALDRDAGEHQRHMCKKCSGA